MVGAADAAVIVEIEALAVSVLEWFRLSFEKNSLCLVGISWLFLMRSRQEYLWLSLLCDCLSISRVVVGA